MEKDILDNMELGPAIARLRGDASSPPTASVIIPVNVQADVENVMRPLADITRYAGVHSIEIVLVLNNFPASAPPPSIERFRSLGISVVAVPDVREPGKRVALAARVVGAGHAGSECTIHFDADCRIPDATALLDWYIGQHRAGAPAAYTHVGFYEVRDELAIHARIVAHHLVRGLKRSMLGIPTIRGSNFMVDRSTLLQLDDEGYLAADFNIGPTFRQRAGKIAYSGRRSLVVLTSGRYIESGWGQLVRYLLYRLDYNLKMLPVRRDRANPDWRQALKKSYPIFADERAVGHTEPGETT